MSTIHCQLIVYLLYYYCLSIVLSMSYLYTVDIYYTLFIYTLFTIHTLDNRLPDKPYINFTGALPISDWLTQ